MLLKKEEFDTSILPEVLDSVRESGECIVETPDSVYVLNPDAVKRLEKLDTALRGSRAGRIARNRGPGCEECMKERRRKISEAVLEFRMGRATRGMGLLDTLPEHDYPQCEACREATGEVVEGFKEASSLAYLDRRDFTRNPVVSSFSKNLPENYSIEEEYEVDMPGGVGFRVRVLTAPDGYYYDPVLPVESLGVKERSLLNWGFRKIQESPDITRAFKEIREEMDDSFVSAVLESQIEGLGDLQFLIQDKNLTDIFIYPSGSVEVSSKHRDMGCTLKLTSKGLEDIASSFRRITDEFFYEDSPLSSYFWEQHNVRISAVGYSGNYTGKPDFAVRLWPEKPWTLLDLVEVGSMDFETAALLTAFSNLGGGTIVGGGRGSGKSTLLQTYMFMVPRRVRKIALLTSREIHRWFNEKRFRISETRVHTGDHVSSDGVPIDEGVKHMLVHGESPYVIFNEIKYREEAAPFFTAAAAAGMNSVLTTMHANTAADIVQRMAIDFELPTTALRTVRWVPVARVDQKPGSTYKRRVLGELTEVLPFRSDPIDEGALKKLAEYDSGSRGWSYAGVDELDSSTMADFVRESDFLVDTGKRKGLTPDGVAEYILLFRDVYREAYRKHGGAPDAATFLRYMETLFSSFPEDGFSGAERGDVLRRWRRKVGGGGLR